MSHASYVFKIELHSTESVYDSKAVKIKVGLNGNDRIIIRFYTFYNVYEYIILYIHVEYVCVHVFELFRMRFSCIYNNYKNINKNRIEKGKK